MSNEFYKEYKIREIRDETPTVKTFVFDRKVSAQPGQFVMAWLPGVSANPFSVADDWPLALTIKKVKNPHDNNSFTWKVFELQEGDSLFISDPRGNPYSMPKSGHKQYIIAGGCGAIPLRFLSDKIGKHPYGNLEHMFIGASASDELLFREEFRNNSKHVWISTDDGSLGHKGSILEQVEEVLDKESPDNEKVQLYICGPGAMLNAAGGLLRKYGLDGDKTEISTEPYMKCGMGGCGACEVNGYLGCIDGPVFSYSDIEDGLGYHRSKSGKKLSL